MKATLEKLENSMVALHIDVEETEWAAAVTKAFKKVGQKVTVPGFRKGRAPRPILERHVGKEYITSEAIELVFPEVYNQAVTQTGIEPIDQPFVEAIDFADEDDSRVDKLTVHVAVKPEVFLKEYKGLAAERLVKQVKDEDVENVLNQTRENFAQLAAADHDTVQNDDFALIDFEGFIDGQPFQGGAAKNYILQIGSGQFIPGFEEQLIGTSLEEEKIVQTKFPEDYHEKELAGKDVEFKVTVHELKTKQLPELDDEFAKDVGEFETLDDLRKNIRQNLQASVASDADNRVKEAIIDAAAAEAEVEIPEVLIDREADRLLLNYMSRLAMQGIDPAPIRDKADEFRKDLAPAAEKSVRQNLVLEAIANKEGISVSPEEIETEIERIIADDTAHADEIRQRFANQDRRSRLAEAIRIEKTIDFLVENAAITEREWEPESTSADSADSADNEEE